jgi:CRP/FNR family cyclic AMP-dependent transcriptional regulator
VTTTPASRRELTARIELFAGLDAHAQSRLADIAVRRTLAADTAVVRQGESDEHFYAIADGLLQVSVQAVGDREIVLGLLGRGAVFGELNLFDGKTRSANVTTLRRSELLVFRREDYLRVLLECPEVALSMLRAMAMLVRKLTIRAEELSALPVPARLAKKLLEIAEICGVMVNDNQVALPPALSQQQLANHVQATRESVNKSLSVWIKDGVLQRTNSQLVILDRARLQLLVHASAQASPLLASELTRAAH